MKSRDKMVIRIPATGIKKAPDRIVPRAAPRKIGGQASGDGMGLFTHNPRNDGKLEPAAEGKKKSVNEKPYLGNTGPEKRLPRQEYEQEHKDHRFRNHQPECSAVPLSQQGARQQSQKKGRHHRADPEIDKSVYDLKGEDNQHLRPP